MKITLAKKYTQFQTQLTTYIDAFETSGTQFGDPGRNSIKLFDLQGEQINIRHHATCSGEAPAVAYVHIECMRS